MVIKRIKRSSDFWLVAYFLSRCSIRQEGQDSLPPKQLKIDLWKEAYDLFFESIADGRTPEAFRRSLKQARDRFDSHISSSRRGWRNPETDEPIQLPNLARKVLEHWEPARDQELWLKVTEIIDLALKPNDSNEVLKGLGEESPKITFETIAQKQNQPFLRKLINFCRSQSTKPTLEEFLKKKQFSFPSRECFRSMNVRFNDEGNYVRIFAPLKSGFSIDGGRRVLQGKFRSELDFTIQEHETTDVLHPFIETPQQCEDLIDWLSSSPDPEKEKRRLVDRKKAITEYFEGDTTDINREILGRAEQAWLRTYLLNHKPINECAICGKDFQNDFLVAAHIKRRAECSKKEKKDPSIGMLLCRFGCDELYERGYLVISEEGKVIINKKCECSSVSFYLDSVVNRNCTSWNKSTEGFFAWHREWHSQ